ncbi:hypothetical protein [Elioraea rosea]|uniref:hypothetical protein n=1 Tax=Elioraea rosea TaxID=2492390 RepID=UPI001182B391|nr:hypothetical protein [Elioraea rosea]
MKHSFSAFEQRGRFRKRFSALCTLAVTMAGLAIAEPARADVIRFYFDNMAAYFGDRSDPTVIISPTRAGFVQFSLAEYYAGIDFSLFGPQ